MTRGLVSIGIGASVVEAVHKMGQDGFRHLLVEDEHGRLAGVVSQHRLLERLGFMLHEQGQRHFQRGIETVMAGAGVGCWEFDHERLELLRSSAINNMMGLGNEPSREKLDTVLMRTHPDDRSRLGEQFLDALNGGVGEGVFTTDYRIILPSGEVRWVSSRGQVVEFGPSGKPRWSAGVTVDITENKLAEQQRADSERRFRQLIEDVPLALAYVTASGDFSFLNRGFVELFGYTRDEVPNVTIWGRLAYPDPLYRGHAHDIWKAALAHASENRIPVSPIQFDVCCADGARRMVEIGGIFFGGDFLCTFIDVTERHQQHGILEFGNAILGDVSANRPLPVVLSTIASEIEQRIPNVKVSIMLLDNEAACLRHAAAPSLPEHYLRTFDRLSLDDDPAACAVAVRDRRAYFCSDLSADVRWSAYRAVTACSGLAAALSVPILSTGERVLGVFCLYWQEPGDKLDCATQRYLDAATRLAAVAIENEEQDARLRQASSRMQVQLEELRRWQQLTVGREGRVLELKREVNVLLARLGEAPRYLSVADGESV
jgi:PAS domain S-box-containing protein